MTPEAGAIEPGKAAEAAPKGEGKIRLLTLDDLDGRTRARQHADETREAIVADLGGPEGLSKIELLQAENLALTAAMLRDMQVRALKGESIDPTRIATIENTFNRTAERVGTRKRRHPSWEPARDVRDLARSVLNVLSEADFAGDAEAGGAVAVESPAPVVSEPPEPPKPPERETFLTGAFIERASEEDDWCIYDPLGDLYGFHSDRERATALAKGLLRPTVAV